MCNSCRGITPHLDFARQSNNKRIAVETTSQSDASPFNKVFAFLTFLVIFQLPKDILLLILEPFQKDRKNGKESPFMRLVCKQWNSLIPHTHVSLTSVAYYYAKNGNLNALQYLKHITTM